MPELEGDRARIEWILEQNPSSIAQIQRLASIAFGVSVDDMCGPRRSYPLVHARYIAITIARLWLRRSLNVIGYRFHRDHAVVHYATLQYKSLVQHSIDTMRR